MREIIQYILAVGIVSTILGIFWNLYKLRTEVIIEELLGHDGVAISIMKLPEREFYQAVTCDWDGNVWLEGELSKTVKGAMKNLLKAAKEEGLVG